MKSLIRSLFVSMIALLAAAPAFADLRVATSLTDLASILQSKAVPDHAIRSTLVLPEALGGRRMISVIRGPWQLITSESGREELIDLRTAATVKASPLFTELRADTAALQSSWPRQRVARFRSVGYIH